MALSTLLAPLMGRPWSPPPEWLVQHPELGLVRWRRGGVPPRVAGWFLLQRTVAAVTLWDFVFIAPEARVDAELLLHEFAHVQQFRERLSFPILYAVETLRRGYQQNRFEVDARQFAADRIRRSST